MIYTWTEIDLANRVGPEPKPEEKASDNRPTIRELLLSAKNKHDFFKLARGNKEQLLEDWAQECGFNSVKAYVISSKAIAKYGSKSGT